MGSSLGRFRKLLDVYGLIGVVAASTVVIFTVASWIYSRIRHQHVNVWALIVFGAVAVALFVMGLIIGQAHGAEREQAESGQTDTTTAIVQLEGALSYLAHVRNFMEGLRLSAIGLPPADALPRLRQLLELVFDAIIQVINTAPGEHIRCALFEPREENGETVLRVRAHRGHTHRVEHLALHMTSIAGIALTTRAALYIPDAENDPRVESTTAGRPVRTLFCIPLYRFEAGRDDPIGVFSVASNNADAFSESDRTFIEACADMVSIVEFFIDVWQQMLAQAQAVVPPPAPAQQAIDAPQAAGEEAGDDG